MEKEMCICPRCGKTFERKPINIDRTAKLIKEQYLAHMCDNCFYEITGKRGKKND